ncbi:thioredoxin family protein [Halobacillus salinus]|uniref:Thioredoxin n=1 Tax=Halobacillus salinus TaxID=192814 RepID=A0A4Z0GWQ6_9BACI|nr:thioredoxin family protein [Halobacillus salinus]TGB02220.1 thioredoxin [Halobacillus salinus]
MQDLGTQAEVTIGAEEQSLIFVHSPFCGTCHLAERMLVTLEETFQEELFRKCNASLNPNFMEKHKVQSVPCLLIATGGEVVDRIYAFHSVPYLYECLSGYVRK